MPNGHPSPSQTLSRGLRVLELVAQSEAGMSVAELAAALGVHRAIVYRLAATLEDHVLVVRQDGRLTLGAGVVALAARVEAQLRQLAQPLLRELAEATEATAFLCVAQGDTCVAIEVAEPQTPFLRVSYRVGSRHPISRGAAGLAIASLRPETPDEPEAVRQARREGFSVTRGQLQPGAIGVAVPLRRPAPSGPCQEACIGVVALHDLDVPRATAAALACAGRLAGRI